VQTDAETLEELMADLLEAERNRTNL